MWIGQLRRFGAIVVVLAALAAACSSATEGEPPTTLATSGTTSSDTSPVEVPEGPAAPDFTLALGADQDDTFVLSEEPKPVYMVFWAEW